MEQSSSTRWSRFTSRVRVSAPTLTEWIAALSSALLLILAFPNAGFFPLSFVGLVPLLLVIARRPSAIRAFLLGWATGSVFFYGSCYWLTYSMIHYGNLPSWLAYSLLLPGALVIGLFPGLFALLTALASKRFGTTALLFAPFFWAASEWVRLSVTGQLWNALGYSLAEAWDGLLIQSASWGGVYAVSFFLLSINCAIVLALLKRNALNLSVSIFTILLSLSLMLLGSPTESDKSGAPFYLYVVAVQPNVPMTIVKSAREMEELRRRHLSLSTDALSQLPPDNVPRLVVWPESPMNFSYANDRSFQELVAKFTTENHTALLFNSLEPAPENGAYNSALLINEEGRLIAQYDKIRLMPFGEYVPLPRWLPGASLITGLVGEFTPGSKYTLMPVAKQRAGVFICIESAYPWIARRLTYEGADVLINISNDGYLGPTAVMRQHLANTIFRAVENGRPLLRVTNTGLSAEIRPDGYVQGITKGFSANVSAWKVSPALTRDTFYTRRGDLFVQLCTLITIGVFLVTVYRRKKES